MILYLLKIQLREADAAVVSSGEMKMDRITSLERFGYRTCGEFTEEAVRKTHDIFSLTPVTMPL